MEREMMHVAAVLLKIKLLPPPYCCCSMEVVPEGSITRNEVGCVHFEDQEETYADLRLQEDIPAGEVSHDPMVASPSDNCWTRTVTSAAVVGTAVGTAVGFADGSAVGSADNDAEGDAVGFTILL
jgi:hypothetical protein